MGFVYWVVYDFIKKGKNSLTVTATSAASFWNDISEFAGRKEQLIYKH